LTKQDNTQDIIKYNIKNLIIQFIYRFQLKDQLNSSYSSRQVWKFSTNAHTCSKRNLRRRSRSFFFIWSRSDSTILPRRTFTGFPVIVTCIDIFHRERSR